MVEIKVHYICDLCWDEMYIDYNKNIPTWITKTEVGDLCPACMTVWETTKKTFIENMKEFNNESKH